jgi:hypothetical protein
MVTMPYGQRALDVLELRELGINVRKLGAEPPPVAAEHEETDSRWITYPSHAK